MISHKLILHWYSHTNELTQNVNDSGGLALLREAVLEFRFWVRTSAREYQSSRKVNTRVKVNTGIFAKGGPFVDLKNKMFAPAAHDF